MVNIIITRPEDDAAITAKSLADNNFGYFIEPAIKVEFPKNIEEKIIRALSNADGIIITSKNALRAIKEITINKDTPLITVGKSTYNLAREYGFQNTEYAGENVIELCSYTKSNYANNKLIYLSGNNITQELNTENCGADIKRILVYKTIPTTALSEDFKTKLISEYFSGIMFFSKKSAEIFCNLLKKEGLEKYIKTLNAFCLSKQIQKKITSYGFKATIYSKKSDTDTILELLVNFQF